MSPLKLFICIPATWYIAYILTAQKGPFSVLERLRGISTLNGVLSCIYCVAPYVAGILYLLAQHEPIGYPVVQILAIAGGALMLRSYTGAGVHGL